MSFYSLAFTAFIGCQQCIFFLLKLSGSHVIKVSSDSCGNFPFRIVFNIFLNKVRIKLFKNETPCWSLWSFWDRAFLTNMAPFLAAAGLKNITWFQSVAPARWRRALGLVGRCVRRCLSLVNQKVKMGWHHQLLQWICRLLYWLYDIFHAYWITYNQHNIVCFSIGTTQNIGLKTNTNICFFHHPKNMAMDSEGIYTCIYIMSSLLIAYNNKSYVTTSIQLGDDFWDVH